MEKPEIQIRIDVPVLGDVVVRARRNQIPVQGLLGPVVVAVCAACLPPGRYSIVAGPSRESAVDVAMCDASLIDDARAKLALIAIDVEALALRPSLS